MQRSGAGLTSTPQAWRIGLALLVASMFVLGAAWSLMTAPFTTVDESRHFNSIVRLWEGGGWPAPREAPMLDAVRLAAVEAGHPLDGDAALPAPVPAGERSALNSVSGAERGVAGDPDWMTQHPPGYYGLTATILGGLGAHGWSWDHALLGARLLGDLWVALAAVPIAVAARRMTGRPRSALIATAALLAVPQYFHIGGLVSNDSLSVLIAATVLCLCVVSMDSPRPGWRLPLATGVALGAGLATKGLFLALIPVVLIAVVIPAWRAFGARWRVIVAPAIAMLTAFVIGGWWYVRNLLVFGALQPSNFGSGRNEVAVEGYDLGHFIVRWAVTMNHTFWGSLRGSLDLPAWFDLIAVTAAAVTLVVGLVAASHRVRILILGIYPAALTAITLHHAWEIYWNTGAFRGIQGRYLYPACAVFIIIAAFAWVAVTRRLSWGVTRLLTGLGVIAFAVVGAAGWVFAMRRLWAESEGLTGSLADMGDALGVAGPVALATPFAYVAAVAALAAWVTHPRLEGHDPAGAGEPRTVPVRE
ncbi:DUF2142 domain-containing protein [Demequina sp. SO4-18]|uniref:DUF2142 domain-containing protein n=1 Tax=Demequina sp. SO4-18 TaxID=3401026 RepID=UPI003B59432E